jgi:hypothetical protein
MNTKEKVRQWYVPLSRGTQTMRSAYAELSGFALKADDIPFLIRLIENPEYDLPGIDIFHGATTLQTHDYIHMLLGRGLLAKDEAFVLGFTMGSTDRVSTTEERLYTFCAKYLFPKHYRFDDEDVRVFRDAVKLGFVSDCRSLATVSFEELLDLPLAEARRAVGLEDDLLRAYYAIEKRRYPHSFESQRLLD